MGKEQRAGREVRAVCSVGQAVMGKYDDVVRAGAPEGVPELGRLGLWSWDVTTGQVNWTDTLFEIFGLDPATFTPTYDGYLDLVEAGHRARVAAMIAVP